MTKLLYYSKETGDLLCYETTDYLSARQKQKDFSNSLVRVEIEQSK